MNKYDDIINLDHPISKNHPRMPIEKRASIFSPFAALTGFSDKIKDTEKEKFDKVIIDENKKELFDEKLKIIENNLPCSTLITYFDNDNLKYLTKKIMINKIDNINKKLITINKEKIDINDIYEIEINNS